MHLTQKEKKSFRARWNDDLLLRINTDLIRSAPKHPVWPMEQLRNEFQTHVVGGETFVDLRGLTLYELRDVKWEQVDLSGALFRKGILGPRLIGTGSIGSIASHFRNCLFSYIDASDANVEGSYEQCDFAGAKMKMMHFFVGARLHMCNFRDAILDQCKAIANVKFSKCDFTGAMMRQCSLEDTVFTDCVFDEVVFDGSAIIGVKFERCSMKNVSIQRIVSEKNTFLDMDDKPF